MLLRVRFRGYCSRMTWGYPGILYVGLKVVSWDIGIWGYSQQGLGFRLRESVGWRRGSGMLIGAYGKLSERGDTMV